MLSFILSNQDISTGDVARVALDAGIVALAPTLSLSPSSHDAWPSASLLLMGADATLPTSTQSATWVYTRIDRNLSGTTRRLKLQRLEKKMWKRAHITVECILILAPMTPDEANAINCSLKLLLLLSSTSTREANSASRVLRLASSGFSRRRRTTRRRAEGPPKTTKQLRGRITKSKRLHQVTKIFSK